MHYHLLLIGQFTTEDRGIVADIQRYGLNVAVSGFAGPTPETIGQQAPPAIVIDTDEQTAAQGYQLCHQLTTHPATAHIPVILFVQSNEAREAPAASRAGAYDCIAKDAFVVRNLIATLRHLKLL